MSREHNNTMQKLILNYTRLPEHTHYVSRYAHEEVDECAVTSERRVFVILIIIVKIRLTQVRVTLTDRREEGINRIPT